MKYNVGNTVIYKAITGKKYLAKVIDRNINHDNGWISNDNHEGNFDYLVEYDNNGITDINFCVEEDLSKPSPDNLTL